MLHRLLLNADLHVTDHVRAFLQFGETERLGGRGITSTTDINHFDVRQAFIDFHPPPSLGDAMIDLFAVRPASDSSGVFDDHTNQNQSLWGGYLTIPIGPVLKADLYKLNYQNKTARYRGLTGMEERQTFGVRLFGEAGAVDWNIEAALQAGNFRGRDIRAGMTAGIVGFTFRDVMWTPRIAIESNFASGDDAHGSAIGTFNAMCPCLPYFAETSLLVPANVIPNIPTLYLTLRRVTNVLVMEVSPDLVRAPL